MRLVRTKGSEECLGPSRRLASAELQEPQGSGMHDLWTSLVCPPLASDLGRLVPPAALPPWWEEERQDGAPQCEVHAVYVRSHFGSEWEPQRFQSPRVDRSEILLTKAFPFK